MKLQKRLEDTVGGQGGDQTETVGTGRYTPTRGKESVASANLESALSSSFPPARLRSHPPRPAEHTPRLSILLLPSYIVLEEVL